jgi:hypothetical protein
MYVFSFQASPINRSHFGERTGIWITLLSSGLCKRGNNEIPNPAEISPAIVGTSSPSKVMFGIIPTFSNR